MNGFYRVLELLKWHFDNDPIVNTMTEGDIFEVDLNKQTIFPLVHLIVNNASFETNVVRYNVSLLAMDIVDLSKDETTDLYRGNSNEQDVLNTQLAVLNRAYDMMLHGNLWDLELVVDGNPNCEPFTERFENYLAGWTMTFDLLIPNEMTICETSGYSPFCPDTILNILLDEVQVATYSIPSNTSENIEIVWQ